MLSREFGLLAGISIGASIWEAQQLARQLQKANIQLQKLNELKNRFVDFAAHDPRKPVGVIQTYTEF